MADLSKYNFTVEYSQVDKLFIGKCKEFPSLFAEGDTEEEALEEINDIVEDYLEDFANDDCDFPTDEDNPRGVIVEEFDFKITKTDTVIGIPAWRSSDGVFFGAGIQHLKFIQMFGNYRILMPWEKEVEIDLLYLPGGPDLNPANYNAPPDLSIGSQDPFKEYFYRMSLPLYVEKGTPIFGVCLGSQQLAAYFGCTLCQHLENHAQSKSRGSFAHKVYTNIKTIKGERVLDKGSRYFDVNSHHHQCLTEKRLNKNIEPLLYAENEDDDFMNEGFIIEAFKVKSRPIYGVQYHPEDIKDNFACSIMQELLK